MTRILAGLLAAAAIPATPVMAQNTVQSISESDRQLGEQAHPQLVQQFGGEFRGPQAAFVERVGRRVAVQSGLSRSGSDFTVTLLDSPVENAFAIPGGYIYATRQLLALMNSEAELASVLGHEVGHVAARHSATRNRTAQRTGIAAAILGAVTGNELVGRGASGLAQLYTLRYGREQEYQADSLGVRYMTAAGYNPFAAADILAALDASTSLSGQQGRAPTWASTHPNGEERVRRTEQLARATGRPQPAQTTQDTAFLRMLNGLPYGQAAEGRVIRIVTVGPKDTIDTMAARMVDPQPRERFLVLNGVPDDQPLRPGSLVKLVTRR